MDGSIDMSAYKVDQVNIGTFSRELNGSSSDLAKAWAALKNGKGGRTYTATEIEQLMETHTWDHTGTDGQLQLVPKVINDAFPHTGGAAFSRAGVWGKAGAVAVGAAAFVSSTAEALSSEHPSAEGVVKGVILDASKSIAAGKMVLDGWLAAGRHVMQSLENQVYGPPGEDDEYENYRTK